MFLFPFPPWGQYGFEQVWPLVWLKLWLAGFHDDLEDLVDGDNGSPARLHVFLNGQARRF